MEVLQNLEGPIGLFTATLERKKLGPEHAYGEAVDVYNREPFCYDPELFTAEGLEDLAAEASEDDDDDGGRYDETGRFHCGRPICVLCH